MDSDNSPENFFTSPNLEQPHKKIKESHHQIIVEALKTVKGTMDNLISQPAEDEDTLFGRCIAASLKKITNKKQKALLKSKIFLLISEHSDD